MHSDATMSGVQTKRRSVLFVDESNTRLSFMAEHVARERWGHLARVASAGWDARESAPSERAVAALAAHGLHIETHRPQRLRSVDAGSFDVVVAMSRAAAEKVPRAAWPRMVVWSVPDPWQGSDAAYAEVIAALVHGVESVFSGVPAGDGAGGGAPSGRSTVAA